MILGTAVSIIYSIIFFGGIIMIALWLGSMGMGSHMEGFRENEDQNKKEKKNDEYTNEFKSAFENKYEKYS